MSRSDQRCATRSLPAGENFTRTCRILLPLPNGDSEFPMISACRRARRRASNGLTAIFGIIALPVRRLRRAA